MKTAKSKLTVLLVVLALLTFSLGLIFMPKAQQVSAEETEVVVEEKFYIEDGASARLEAGESGIKWTAHINKVAFDNITSAKGTIEEIGIAIKPYGVDIEWSHYPFAGRVEFSDDGSEIIFPMAIYYDDIIADVEDALKDREDLDETAKSELIDAALEEAYAMVLEAVPYAKAKPAEGDAEYVYGEAYDTARSVQGVALYYLVNGKYSDYQADPNNENYENILKGYIPGTYALVGEYKAEGVYYCNYNMKGDITLDSDLVSAISDISNAKVYYKAKDVTYLLDTATNVVALTDVQTEITTDGSANDYLIVLDSATGKVYKQYFVGVSLAIYELSDFMNYFKMSGNDFSTSGKVDATIPEGEAEWDGYYIMMADIEGAGTAYNASISHDLGNFKDLDPYAIDNALANGVTNGIMENGKPTKGLTGTFDGNGHQIKNLRTLKGGLFGMILGGTVKNLYVNKTGYVTDSVLAHVIAGGATIENVKVVNDRSNVYQQFALVAMKIGDATIKNVMLENTYANVTWEYNLSYAGYPASFGNVTADTKVENVIIISKIEAAGTLNKDSWTPTLDAEYVDGVLNQTEGLTKLVGARRYSSLDAFNADKANIDFSTWDPSAWVILDNTPTFRTTLENAEYGAYVDGNSVTEGAVELVEGNQATVTLKYGINAINIQPILTIVSGEEYVSVEGNVITALASGEAVLKATYGKYQWTINVSVMAGAGEAIDIPVEYQFSAYDGLFFDGANVVPFSTILEQLTDLGEIVAFVDSNENVLTYNQETGAITGLDLGKQTTWKEDSFIVMGENASYRLLFRAADLIIDEATDFAYFTLDGTFTASANSISYSADDFVWDGYHVMVKDIDAKAYTHNAAVGADPSVASMATVAATNYGLSGVFDGQGHTISKMFIRAASANNSIGLFGYINGGTVKNVAFDNLYSGTGSAWRPSGTANYSGQSVSSKLFATYLVNNASIEDCVISVHSSQAYETKMILSGADNTSSMTRVVIKQEKAVAGTGHYSLFRNISATLNDVYVIAPMPLHIATRNANGKKTTIPTGEEEAVSSALNWKGGSLDATTVDDVTRAYVNYVYDYTNNVQISLDEYTVATSAGKVYSSSAPFSTSVLTGIKRYSSLDAMKANWTNFAEGNAMRNDFTNWSSSIWTISAEGIPSMHAITE